MGALSFGEAFVVGTVLGHAATIAVWAAAKIRHHRLNRVLTPAPDRVYDVGNEHDTTEHDMSITFTPAHFPTPTAFAWACQDCVMLDRFHWDDPARYVGQAPTWEDAVLTIEANDRFCDACGCATLWDIDPVGLPDKTEVNLSNTNAQMVLRALGLDATEYGTIPAEDLRARAMLGTIEVFEGRPTVTHRDEGRATFIECGVDAEYLARVCARLVAVADEAAALGVDVQWA